MTVFTIKEKKREKMCKYKGDILITGCIIMDVAAVMSPIGLWTVVLKPQVWILAAAILLFCL